MKGTASLSAPFNHPPAAGLACLLIFIFIATASAAPRSPRLPVVSEYHGVQVTDDYRWLENGTNPVVQRWTAAQNKTARSFLDRLPTRPWVEERLRHLLTDPSTNYFSLSWRHGTLFLLKFEPPAQQPVLITLSSVTNLESEHVILDLNKLDPSGGTSMDWYVPSPDGSRVAVCLSEHGSELGTLYFYETATGRRLDEAVPRVHGPTAGGSAAWDAAGNGVFYTRYPHAGERPEADLSFYQQVHFHRLGSAQDTYEIGKEFPRIAEITLQSGPDGRRLLATVANGDGGEYAHYLRDASGQWRQVTRFQDRIVRVEFGRDPLYLELPRDDALYLLSRHQAPMGQILRLPLAAVSSGTAAGADLSKASIVVAEGTNVIRDFRPAASGLALVLLQGGSSELSFYEFSDRRLRGPTGGGGGGGGPGFGGFGGFGANRERPIRSIQDLLVTYGDEVWFREISYTAPYSWHRYNISRDSEFSDPTPLSGKAPADFGDVEVVREMVPSKDGTRIPLNIIRKRGTRMLGENPTLLTGYGGYGVSLEPNFVPARRLWLDQGGVIAVANLRGGGEFGEDWHQAGNLTRKQNVFDDFAACAEFLIHSNYTKPAKLAVEGGSNGGLLMGAFLTQHPELARAVVSHVGLYDMLRAELDPNGAFNVTEYGSVRDLAQFRALQAYSPFHKVHDGTAYPAILFLTGEHDGRVNPAHSRKMTARVQAASISRKPVLLRTSPNTGHGVGTPLDAQLQELVDVYSFLFDQLGVDYSLVDRGPWSGALTPNSALVKAKLAQPGLRARLVLSKSPLLTRRSYSEIERPEPDRYNMVEFDLRKLEPDTLYYYALEIEGRLDRAKGGEFHTFPAPGPASFQFAFASCARTGSTSDVFDRIRENHPLFFIHMGDFQYLDIRTNSRARFRAAYDSVLASPQQSDMFRHVPMAYIWDDHDFGGNGSDGRSPTHEAARLTYEEFVPHYPLVFDRAGPISQSFSVGRVKFILTDLRSMRSAVSNVDDEQKTMMGVQQKEWFKRELLEANGKYPLICWVSSVPWIGLAGTNVYRSVGTNQFGFIHHTNLLSHARTNSETSGSRTNSARGARGGRGAQRGAGANDEDHWSVFSTERREIADFIKSNHIQGLCLLHGDSHMVAADDGSNSDYATGGGAPIPILCGAPLDQEPSLKGGPYSQGVYKVRRGEGCFGFLTVQDRGDRIDVSYSGRNNQNDEKISLKFTVPAVTAVAKKISSRALAP